VTLISYETGPQAKTSARATTDAAGRYTLTNVAPGRYQIMPVAPTSVVVDADYYQPGKSLNLSAGESVEDINFEIVRGGVITGRVTDSDGKPLVEENVQLVSADNKTPTRTAFNPFTFKTDDRGIYRLYGLAPGRYLVSVGLDKDAGAVRAGGSGKFYRRTFYPGTTEEAQAKPVEVTAGGEASDVDITLGKPTVTFKAAGRVVNAETGRPVTGVLVGVGPLDKRSNSLMSLGARLPVNSLGDFQIENLASGRYSVFATSQDATDWYSDSAAFDIEDADVSSIEVKVHRGATLSGVVQLEGVTDRVVAARLLSRISLMAFPEHRDGLTMPPVWMPARAALDGSFHINGIRPGRVRLSLAGVSDVKGLMLVRVEREGVEQQNGIEIAEGAQVTGVRLVFVYGTAVVRGQLNFVNGTLPQGASVAASARRLGTSEVNPAGRYAEVDARGHFILEGLAPGDYEIIVRSYSTREMKEAKQLISVPSSGELTVTLALDLGEGAKP
ncbi:MAG: carboxypeptidase-like regulatory domain-containing protein, partial [Pyrinomonadaceae bacterium]